MPLPGDHFEQAAILTALKPAIDALRESLPETAIVKHEIVRARTETAPRKPRTKKNGAVEKAGENRAPA